MYGPFPLLISDIVVWVPLHGVIPASLHTDARGKGMKFIEAVRSHVMTAFTAIEDSGIVDVDHGALAQLGERMNGIHEAAGSIPAGSTKG